MTTHPRLGHLGDMTPVDYRIVIRGQLSDRSVATFDGVATEPGRGETALVGRVRDQPHLYGILERVRDFGLGLLRIAEDER